MKDNPLRYTQTERGEEHARSFLKAQIESYNDAHSPAHKSLRRTGRQTLDIFIHNEHDEIVGGLLAATYWGWLYIDELWVAEALRAQGHGRRLVDMAEREGCNRACTHAMVKTWSFQARGFYEKLGYKVVGILEDYPEGASFYWLRKAIISS